MAAPHPLLLMHPWKSKVESSGAHLSQALAWGLCRARVCPLNIITASRPGVWLSLLADAWESGVTFQGDKR